MKNILLFFFIFIFVISCIKQEDEDFIAQVNKENLTLEELRSNFSENEWKNITPEEKNDFIQEWIQLTLLSQESDRLGITETPGIKSKIKTAEKTIKSNAVIAQRFSDIEISENDLFDYYKLHKNKFQKSWIEYKLQRIFVKDKTKLGEIRKYILSNSFKEAAKKYSEENYGKNGGYIGFVSENNTKQEIWDALLSLEKHRFKTVETDKGNYIIRFYDKKTVYAEKTFKEVIEQIRELVKKDKKEDIYNDLIEELKKKSEISISI